MRGVPLALAMIVLTPSPSVAESSTGVLVAGFVCTPGVYNSELMAPLDVLQHSVYRDEVNYIRTLVVTETGEPFLTAEGLRIVPDHSFQTCPDLDIVLIPSSEHSMEGDLQNEHYLAWLKQAIEDADHVISLCDGAFPLAATGALDGRVATTFPGDRDRFREMFPAIDVRYDVRFVVDGKFITSVGGAPSYEPAFYLVERLYGVEHARRTGQGLVVDWDLAQVPHLVVDAASDR